MSPQPQTDSLLNDLFRRRRGLETHFRESFLLDEVEARRLSKDFQAAAAKGSISQLQRGALLHDLAYVEALRGNKKSSLDFMDRARFCGMNDLSITVSKAHLLTMFGCFSEARLILASFSIENAPAAANSSFRGLCEEVGMYKVASGLEVAHAPSEYLSNEASKILESAGISDADVTERLDYAASIVVSRAKHRLLAYDLFALDGEGILFRFVVDGPEDELLSLDWELTEKVAERFDGPLDSVLSIGIKPFSKGESHFAYGSYHAYV